MDWENALVQWRKRGFAHFVLVRFALYVGTIFVGANFLVEYLYGTTFDQQTVVRLLIRSYVTATVLGSVLWSFKRLK